MLALVLGVNGQDGSYIAEHLLRSGYTVCGVARQANSRCFDGEKGYSYARCDVTDPEALKQLLDTKRPDLIFHVAAVHGSSGFHYESVAVETLMVNLVSVQVILEYLRCINPAGFLFYASSAKVFANPLPKIVDEGSPKSNSCLYSYTKNSAAELISFYRNQHGIAASVVYLFQHESPRRGDAYFIPKVCKSLIGALDGRTTKVQVVTLDFYCDWGAAEEYMEIVLALAKARISEDFVLASGVTWHARQFVEALFSYHNMEWRAFIEEKNAGPSTQPFFQVSTAHLQKRLGIKPKKSILDVCEEIIQIKSLPR